MFISNANFLDGVSISESNDPNEPIRVQFGANNDGFAIYLSRIEALDLYSKLEKAIHQTA